MKIYLNQQEVDFVKNYAERFCEHKGKESSDKYKQGSDTALAYDIKGYSGEFAVHKHFGVDMPDFNPEYTKRDMVISYGEIQLSCDIKTSIYSKEDEDGVRYKVMGIKPEIFKSNLGSKKIPKQRYTE